ncbi:MAG: ABC transporter ATP-binding protein [Candidatus Saganbacteria bacterium]|nr:ABC transporter ATP-binding protein [Candidatus Saganbacteria bacterium]
MLDIRKLSTNYYQEDSLIKAIDDVSLSVDSGEVIGIVGESGCGKSTLGLSILKLISPPGKIVRGEIYWDGTDLLNLTDQQLQQIRGKEISMIFQDPFSSLNPVFKVGEQIAETLRVHEGSSKDKAWDRAVEILEMTHIPNARLRAGDYPHQFSGGMLQRAMIAMAIACDPKLLIADEPTTALDVTIQAGILDLLKELEDKKQMSMILITHNFGIVSEICDRVAVMYAGKIVEEAKTSEIFRNPLHPYTIGLLESLPEHGRKVERLKMIPGQPPDLCDLPMGCSFNPRCSRVQSFCHERMPDLIEKSPGHFARCHFV